MFSDVTGIGWNRIQAGCVEHDKGPIGLAPFDVGELPDMEIDVGTVTDIASTFDGSSGALSGVAGTAKTWAFGADQAGRNYGDLGARIAEAYGGAASMLTRWSEASKDNAVQLRGSCAQYTSTDESVSHSFTGVVPAGER